MYTCIQPDSHVFADKTKKKQEKEKKRKEKTYHEMTETENQ